VNALFFSRLYLNITLVKSEKIRDTQECKQVKHLKIDVKCFNPACFWTRLHKMDWLITRVQNFENTPYQSFVEAFYKNSDNLCFE